MSKKERQREPTQRAIFSVNFSLELRDELGRVADSIGYSRNQFIEAICLAGLELIEKPNSVPLVIDLARHRKGK